MHSAYHTLLAVVPTLSARLSGRALEEAFTQDRDELVLSFSGPPDHLVVSCRADALCCYLHPTFARAKRNSVTVLAASAHRTVRGVSLHPNDRLVSIELSGNQKLVFRLFGTRANVFLLSGEGGILDAFKHSRELVGQPFTWPPGHTMPSPEELVTGISSTSQETLSGALKKAARLFPAIVVREILHRAGLPVDVPTAALQPDHRRALIQTLSSVAGDLENPQPRIYLSPDGTPSHFSIIPLSVLAGCREDHFDDIHAALRSFIAWKRSAADVTRERALLENRIRSTLAHAERIVRAIDADLAAADRAEQYMEYGSLLLQHLAEIPPGSSLVHLPGPGGTIAVPLQPHQTASQNAQRYFEKAKASRRARQLAERRRGAYKHRLDRHALLLEELKHVTTRQDLKAYMERHDAELHGPGDTGPTDDQDRPLFRTFVVEGGFEVWAGKSSANNDTLTLRHAKPQDYWFHARGVPGSHVILRIATGRGEPGKQAIRQAASIAAYYSKMRTASLVPVAVTRRKYVHKRKGAPAGSVVLQREDVIMVEPELPPSAEDDNE